jgi:hypothetical protein
VYDNVVGWESECPACTGQSRDESERTHGSLPASFSHVVRLELATAVARVDRPLSVPSPSIPLSAAGRGGFFSALRAHPEAFLVRRPGLRRILRRLRGLPGGAAGEDGQSGTAAAPRRTHHVFLATNSQQRFADFLLEFALGPDWRECFDLVIYNALKPAWFAKVCA